MKRTCTQPGASKRSSYVMCRLWLLAYSVQQLMCVSSIDSDEKSLYQGLVINHDSIDIVGYAIFNNFNNASAHAPTT